MANYSSLINQFTKVTSEAFEKADYPAEGPLTNPKWHVHECKANVVYGLGILNRSVGDVAVLCRTKPKKGAFALQKFSAGKLVLVPMSFTIKCEDEGSDDDRSEFVVRGDFPQNKVMVITSPPASVPCPAWYVCPTDDTSKVNMEVRYRKLEVAGKLSGKPAHSTKFEIPVLVNTSSIDRGDELFMFRAAKPQAAKRGFVMLGASTASGSVSKIART